jgi:acetoin utilization deacetylase AcuC-like enzyme
LAATGDVNMALRSKKPYALLRPPGHHATPTVAMGFVLLNSIAIATAANVTGSGTSTVTEEIQTQQQDSEIWIMKSL